MAMIIAMLITVTVQWLIMAVMCMHMGMNINMLTDVNGQIMEVYSLAKEHTK